jgi:hypothetical protein
VRSTCRPCADFVRGLRVDLGHVHAWTSARFMCVDFKNLFHKCPLSVMSTRKTFLKSARGPRFPAGTKVSRTVTLNYWACGYKSQHIFRAVTSTVQQTTQAGYKPSTQLERGTRAGYNRDKGYRAGYNRPCIRQQHGGMETKLVPPLLFGRLLPADPLLLYRSSAARPRVKARAPKLRVRWRSTGAR